MEGGKIVRIIGGKSIKTAKESMTFTAMKGDLIFNAKKVSMVGRKGGVEYHNDYKPPEPLKVTQLEGPFTEEGEKVAVVEKGKSYKFRISRFNREIKMRMELKNTKWAIQFNEEKPIPVAKVMGKQEVTMDISETEISDKITIYAYMSNLHEEGKAETNLKVKTGGINTRFYDEQGQQIYEIPQKLHKAFNEEYGICLAYDKENEMLYYDGDCTPAYEKTSPTAIKYWKKELDREQTSKGKLLFGYNFGFKIISNYSEWEEPTPKNKDKTEEIMFGVCPYVQRRKHSIALIDLGDYDDNLQPLGVSYKLALDNKRYDIYHLEKPQFSNRYMGLARGLEHEFIGHVILNYHDDPELYNARESSEIEIKLGNKIREEIGIPGRLNSTVSNITLDNGRKVSMFVTYYGFINGSDESDPNIYVYPYAPDPAPKFPLLEGHTIISQENVLKLFKVNYIITLNYKYNEKTFDFT